jgi:hypothetical protein
MPIVEVRSAFRIAGETIVAFCWASSRIRRSIKYPTNTSIIFDERTRPLIEIRLVSFQARFAV